MADLQTTAALAGFDDHGEGTPALLMLPGWCGDRSVFDGLAAATSAHDRVVVADLRGQGELVRPADDFDSAQQVDDLVALAERLELEQLVPVALSHAGWFAVELRRRLGAERVPGIVLLDWMVLGTPPGFADALAGLQEPAAWHDVRGALFGMWTAGVEAPAVHEYVASMRDYGFEHWSRAGREIASGFARDASPLAALAALPEPCPTLHLYAQPADAGYLAAQEAAAAAYSWFQVARLDACSHFPMLEVPDVIADHLRGFLAALRVGVRR